MSLFFKADHPNEHGFRTARELSLSTNELLTINFSYGGYFSNFGIFGSIGSHGWASEAHMCTSGLNKLGSSRLEAAMPWPVSLAPPKSREPHSGQNPRLL